MFKYTMRRIGSSIITLFLIITATFFLLALAPGDPIASKVEQMPEQAQAVIKAKYGLDKPVTERYMIYMKNLILKGDFGESIIYNGRSANDIIKKNAPISGKIGLIALILELVIGIGLGLVIGLRRNSLGDQIIRVLVVLAICIPGFVFAALLQYFLAFKWKLVPIFGWGKPIHYVLPVLSYVVGGIASYTKYMRSSTLAVINEDYIITAKAKGCSRHRIIKKHLFRNTMVPMVTMIVPAIAGIFGGSFIIEKMYSIPGMGSYYVKAVGDNDFTMVLGLTIFYAILYTVSLIGVDLLYGVVDPRIKVAEG